MIAAWSAASLPLLAAVLSSAAAQADYCMAQDANPYANFGLRAPYEVSEANLDATPRRLPGCKPVHLWLLVRHGIRHGTEQEIEEIHRLPKLLSRIRRNKDEGRTIELCDADFNNILHWAPGVDKSMALMLTPQGRQDIEALGRRFQQSYPELLVNADNFERYPELLVNATRTTSRCVRIQLTNTPACPDRKGVTFPFDGCPAYRAFFHTDFFKFKNGSEYSDMVRRVSTRLGFDRTLDVADVDDVYMACHWERVRNWSQGASSPWCAAFRTEDFEVFEYLYDMWEYYRVGYGHEAHHGKLGCVPLKDLVKTLSRRVEATRAAPSAGGRVFITHDTLLNTVLPFLGLYRDAARMAETTFAAMRERQWRVTRFSAFDSNLHAVLHECDEGERHRVQMFLNGNLMPLSDWGCDADSCTWSQFLAKFGHVLTDCDQRRACAV